MNVRNMKIGVRLGLGFGLILSLVMILLAFVVTQLSSMTRGAEQIESDLSSRARALDLIMLVKDNGTSSMEMLLSTNSDYHATVIKKIEESNRSISGTIESMDRDSASSPDDGKFLVDIKKQRGLYVSGLEKVTTLLKNGKQEQATYVAGEEMIPALDPFLMAVKKMDEHQGKKLDASIAQIRQSAGSIRNTVVVVGAVVVLLGLFSAVYIVLSITRPLNRMRAAIVDVGKNDDFTRRISIDSMDEVGETAQAFDGLVASLQGIFKQVLESADKVSALAKSLSSSSGDVAGRSSSQSESTCAMAAAVEEMTVSINHISESAREALDISRQSGNLSSGGGVIIQQVAAEVSRIAETVRETSRNIKEVGRHSNEISSIVQVIKDIASQTNLLALNAAIEAARAGEQGRGFAVVADEVRQLAERTTGATEEISGMIGAMQESAHGAVAAMGASVERVNSGVTLANEAGASVDQIKAGAARVVEVVNDISSALAEQSSASSDLAGQVESVAQMTEENSAAVARTATDADNLQELAGAMREAVGRFKI